MPTSSLLDRLAEKADPLLQQLEVPEAAVAEADSSVRTRGSSLEEVIQLLIDLGKTYGAYLGFVCWAVQLLVNRKLAEAKKKYQVFLSAVAGMLYDRGLEKAEVNKAEEMAAEELRRLGLPQDRAESAAKQVVALFLTELPELDREQDPGEQFGRILNLARSVQGWEVKEQPFGCTVLVPKAEGIKIQVHLIARKDRAGDRLVEFHGVCGKVAASDYGTLLKRSGRLPIGAFTIRSSRLGEYVAVQELLPFHRVTLSEMQRIIPFLAQKAEEVRLELGMSR